MRIDRCLQVSTCTSGSKNNDTDAGVDEDPREHPQREQVPVAAGEGDGDGRQEGGPRRAQSAHLHQRLRHLALGDFFDQFFGGQVLESGAYVQPWT